MVSDAISMRRSDGSNGTSVRQCIGDRKCRVIALQTLHTGRPRGVGGALTRQNRNDRSRRYALLCRERYLQHTVVHVLLSNLAK